MIPDLLEQFVLLSLGCFLESQSALYSRHKVELWYKNGRVVIQVHQHLPPNYIIIYVTFRCTYNNAHCIAGQ